MQANIDAAEIRMNDQAKQYEVLEYKHKSLEMLCTTLKATMTDQLQQYGQNKADLNAEITRLQGPLCINIKKHAPHTHPSIIHALTFFKKKGSVFVLL